MKTTIFCLLALLFLGSFAVMEVQGEEPALSDFNEESVQKQLGCGCGGKRKHKDDKK